MRSSAFLHLQAPCQFAEDLFHLRELGSERLWQGQRAVLQLLPQRVLDPALGVHETGGLQMLPEHVRLLEAQRRGLAVGPRGSDSSELVRLHDAETNAGFFLDLLLEFLREPLVTLGRDHGQNVSFEAPQAFPVLVDAETQAASDGLAPLLFGSHLAQCADLKDVRVVPAFAQGRVGKNELQRRFQAQQLLLIPHDQAVGVVVG